MTLSAQSPTPGDTRRSLWTGIGADRVGEFTVGSLLQRAAMPAPDTVALVEGIPDRDARRRWTYAELLADAERAARALLGRFAPGERIAVWANNIPEWLLLQTGAALAGLTLVTVDPALRRNEVAHVLGRSEATGVFLVREYRGNPMAETVAGLRDDLPALRGAVLFEDWAEFVDTGDPAAALPHVCPDDTAQIQFTSGTTGLRRGRCCTIAARSTAPACPTASSSASAPATRSSTSCRCSTPPGRCWPPCRRSGRARPTCCSRGSTPPSTSG
ncbi:MAG: hypothetical protein ABT15_21950 [Pseudonocardia sp. SCN 73-27]|nr:MULTISPECIES: AMP-binding protein [unclassified Pseudonocardia]ODU12244.1 MAG: hypothetical protein ABS80_22185 [Pseudonocardia sp. SCN 72-51]ODV03912.1 MAG: hypothetical protein ABT15_21950 [Pseudonocardia sp. SCN 73-27]